MAHSNSTGRKLALVLGVIMPLQATSGQVVVNVENLAQRVVFVRPTDLANRIGRANIERELRSASRKVCNEQYPGEADIYFVRGCYAGSLSDAWDQLRRIQERELAGQTTTPNQLAVVVRSPLKEEKEKKP